ncbi:chaperonin GroEL [Flavobacteriales bacterium]|nr:chaperonin GroEL [Flavobacteriales bacterium]
MFTPKNIIFDDAGRSKLREGITKMSNAVKSTLGPSGQTVIIESEQHTHGITVTKDGVTVAKSIHLMDAVENLAVRIMREASERTSTQAGDGTTTAIVLTEALIKVTESFIRDYTDINKTDFLRFLKELSDDTIKRLGSSATTLTSKKMLDVATISANNDKALGKIISDVYKEVGRDGVVTVENGQLSDTYYEVTKGMRFERGYTSSLFVNNHETDECVMEDCYVMVCGNEINSPLQIENVLKEIIGDRHKLLLVSPCSVNFINTMGANVMQNGVKFCNVTPPQFGWKQEEVMSDLALSLGAKYFSEKTGDDLALMTMADLGFAKKVVVKRDHTIVMRDEERSDQGGIDQRVKELRAAFEHTNKKDEKDFFLERIASLAGGVGVIYVGGNTDLEQKERYDRVDDAVCAVRSALTDGIVPGGGIALLEQSERLSVMTLKDGLSKEETLAAKVLATALEAPFHQIVSNAGIKAEDVLNQVIGHKERGYGFNVKTRTYGNMMRQGVVDPAKVTKSALNNAVSVATTILSTNAIITSARTYEDASK